MTPIISVHNALQLFATNGARFIDCRFSLADHDAGYRDWSQLRITGARHLHMEHDLAGYSTGSNGRHPLPTRTQFETSLRRAGICQGDTIIFYDDQRLAGAARAWWLLNYFGVSAVRILDGGFRAWRIAGGPIDATTPSSDIEHGDVKLGPANEAFAINKKQMFAELHRRPLVDAREPPRFRGEVEPIDPIAGRIPGATNQPWTEVTTPSGYCLPPAMQRSRWRLNAGGVEPVLYCGSGVTASVNSLSRVIAGLSPGIIYVGSYSEWCNDPSMPIARDKRD